MRDADGPRDIDAQLATAANNQAVVQALTAPPAAERLSAGFVLAKRLWIEWNVANGRPRGLADLDVAAAEHNLAMVARREERFAQAEELLSDAAGR